MTEREQRLEETLILIQEWAEAYPIKTFKPVTVEDLRHASFALRAVGIDLGALHADLSRRIMVGLSDICEEALKP